ncbi:MAG: hypothetical protein KF705_13440 [Phycisphaeraceae bacterium]|nr:hypothetical protein [Phycisphaeraceae bacterium]
MDATSNGTRRLIYDARPPTSPSGAWSAGVVDYASEGEVYTVEFWGYHAEERAREYAAWKNAGNGWMPSTVPERQSCPRTAEMHSHSSMPCTTDLAAPVAH